MRPIIECAVSAPAMAPNVVTITITAMGRPCLKKSLANTATKVLPTSAPNIAPQIRVPIICAVDMLDILSLLIMIQVTATD